MELERRALYNLLRMNWLADSKLKVKTWQVEDLRSLKKEELFQRLDRLGFDIEPSEFLRFAQDFDSPEEMTDEIFSTLDLSNEESDQAFLVLFELWRRELPEKQTLSIFCDELDHQIFLYDSGKLTNMQEFQDTISSFIQILNDNEDRGLSAKECMEEVATLSANDVEDFLYDYISQEIEEGHIDLAHDFVEGFLPYVKDKRWFEFLDFKIKMEMEGGLLDERLQPLLRRPNEISLDYYFEILAFLTKHGDVKTFSLVAKKAIPLFQTEEDFTDFLGLAADFYHLLDDENREQQILTFLKARKLPAESRFNSSLAPMNELKKIIFG